MKVGSYCSPNGDIQVNIPCSEAVEPILNMLHSIGCSWSNAEISNNDMIRRIESYCSPCWRVHFGIHSLANPTLTQGAVDTEKTIAIDEILNPKTREIIFKAKAQLSS